MILRNSLRLIRTLKICSSSRSVVANSCQETQVHKKHKFLLSKPVFDENFLLDEKNKVKISENIKLRKGIGDINVVHEINNKLKNENLSVDTRNELEVELQEELKKIPNQTHPAVKNYGEEPKEIAFFNDKPTFKHSPLDFATICKKLNLLRTDHLSNFAGSKSYYLMSDLAEMVIK